MNPATGNRPGILTNQNPVRKNPGTIGLISSNVAKMKDATFENMKPILRVFESDSDSKESQGDWLNSCKSGVLTLFFCACLLHLLEETILRPRVAVDRIGDCHFPTPLHA